MKLLGMVLGAILGVPVGWLIWEYEYPWVEVGGESLLLAGAIAGAVIGALFPGRTLGGFGWGIVVGTGIGAILGETGLAVIMVASLLGLEVLGKGTWCCEGAAIGFLLGSSLGLVSEIRSRNLAQKSGGEVPSVS